MTYPNGRKSLVSIALVAMLVASATGCGSSDNLNTCSVQGTVTLDGTPVEAGKIMFSPTGGTTGPASVTTIVDGKYSKTAADHGPVVGKHTVRIEAFRDRGNKNSDGTPNQEQVVPAKYNQQTILVVDVAKGNNRHDFDPKSK